MNPSSPRNTRPMIQRRSLRHQSVPSQEEKHEQMTSTTLIESSTSLYPYVDFTSIVHPPREFRDEFGLSSQGIAEYSSANENIGPGGAASSMALGQISQSDFVARDGHLRQRAIALQYPYPGVLPTTEQYQQYQAQQEQSSPKRQRTRQRHQTSHEHQQQHYDQHAHRLPDRSPPSKVSRYEFDTVDKHQTSHGASSLVGREGMPQPAEPPKGPKPKFTPEDDQLLVDLKEKNNLTWKQIADFFPGRSSGTLQVRYCTKLKAKAIEWTEETVSLASALKISYDDFNGQNMTVHPLRAVTVS